MDTTIFKPGTFIHYFISDSFSGPPSTTTIGAQDVLWGKICINTFKDKIAKFFEYPTCKEMAQSKIQHVSHTTFSGYVLTCMYVNQALALIKHNKFIYSLFVSTPMENEYLRLSIITFTNLKTEFPFLGKEINWNNPHNWKVNR